MTQSRERDVLVVGAGPAGSSAAAILAQHGCRVTVLERARFPRYRVGESLIPHCWYPLHRLGLVERLDASAFVVPKLSVQFVRTDGYRTQPFYFEQHYDHPSARTWQVVRSEFDQLLLQNAREQGAEVQEGVRATALLEERGRVTGVQALDEDGRETRFEAAITIDASGRDLFAQSRLGWRVSDPVLKKVAIWTYYRGAQRDPGQDEGATTIAYVPEKGWFWYLPLANDLVSVGVVAEGDYLFREGRDLDAVFAREASIQPWIREHLRSGEKTGPCQVTGDYSYRSRHSAKDGLVLIGDAFAFLDPVFSSGVFLALQSGVRVGDAVHEALQQGLPRAEQFTGWTERFLHNLEAMRCLVYSFYDPDFHFGQLFKKYPHLRPDLTDCLTGNLDRDFTALFDAVREYAPVPEPLPHGRPLMGESTPPGDAGRKDG